VYFYGVLDEAVQPRMVEFFNLTLDFKSQSMKIFNCRRRTPRMIIAFYYY